MERHTGLWLHLYGNTVGQKEETGMLSTQHNFFLQPLRVVCPVYLPFVPKLCLFAR